MRAKIPATSAGDNGAAGDCPFPTTTAIATQNHSIGAGFIPVIAPIAVDKDGHSLNVNADTAAGSIASALNAAKLVLMTDVDGVKTASGERLSSLGSVEAEEMIH